MAGASGGGRAEAAEQGQAEFMDRFGDAVARRDHRAAAGLCRERLRAHPGDRLARELQDTVQHFLDAAGAAEADDADEGDELPPQLDEVQGQAAAAAERAFEAMFAFLQEDGGRLWRMGEQAVGIFWDVGQISGPGPQRERLREMALALTETLAGRLREAGRPQEQLAAGGLSRGEWIFEALGQLWWHAELGLAPPAWLAEGCKEELAATGGRMEDLVGYSSDGLRGAAYGELCEILTQTWTLERSLVCGLFGDRPPVALDYGIGRVFEEVARRPVVEPPLPGFFDCFYTLTHVVYVLNCFNGHLPNRRSDHAWLYAYLERCLAFWLREVRRDAAAAARPGVSSAVVSRLWIAEAVDAIAESVDCLLGLGEPTDVSVTGESIREGVAFLLAQQQEDGLFFSPGHQRDPANEYNHLHPSWTTAAALQFTREAPGPSPRCIAWAQHARAAAAAAGLADAPPPAAAAAPAAPGAAAPAPAPRAAPAVATAPARAARAAAAGPIAGPTPAPAPAPAPAPGGGGGLGRGAKRASSRGPAAGATATDPKGPYP